ncbi:surfeit locus 1 family protein [Methylosinus sp. sav-2]|uniref:SURF1 family protein n=1 Tax=Methylosinus sp. sav-2 TaxID=2485168 RepID=UPI00047B1257|nr:SURF1 family protein [Methylosinus sp. sav-2]TDX62220.1 surfeit locus 1 family protein [Methylosinus sp. sav-2]
MRAEARALLGPAIFSLFMAALLAGLGVWQLRRLAWKEALIERVETRATAVPVAPPPRAQWDALAPQDYDFTHVRASGHFDLSREALIFSPPPSGAGVEPGYRVIAPLLLDEGGAILVDRGFLPLSQRGDETRKREPSGPITLTGLLRGPQARNLFTPADSPQEGLFYTGDARALAAYLQIADAAPFLLELDPAAPTPGLPRVYDHNIELSNNHLSYAITWFSLSAAVAGGFAFYAFGRLKQR